MSSQDSREELLERILPVEDALFKARGELAAAERDWRDVGRQLDWSGEDLKVPFDLKEYSTRSLIFSLSNILRELDTRYPKEPGNILSTSGFKLDRRVSNESA